MVEASIAFSEQIATISEKSIIEIENKRQKLNFLLILYGLSLVNEREDLFNYCVRKLARNMEEFPQNYEEARLRTCNTMRKLLEFVLISAIVASSVE